MRRYLFKRATIPTKHPRAVLLACGCTITYSESPPGPGEQVTCLRCKAETRAVRKERRET